METERSYNPEAIKQEQRIYFKDFFSRIKARIVDKIEEVLEDNDEDVKRYKRDMSESEDVSKSVADYYQELTKRSLRDPEKDYSHQFESSIGSFADSRLFYLRKLRKLINSDNFDQIKKILLDNSNIIDNGEVIETNHDGERIQKMNCDFEQGSGHNIIHENVVNLLREDINAPYTELSLTDRKSGKTVNFNQMLPKEFGMAPAQLLHFQSKFDKKNGEIVSDIEPVDLKSYNVTTIKENGFQEEPNLKMVYYGDLKERGGILNLLHEISHAWQSVYYEGNNRGKFEEVYKKVCTLKEVFEQKKQEKKDGKISEDFYERISSYFDQQFSELGIEIGKDESDSSDQDRVALAGWDENKFVVKSDKLVKLADKYVWEERDAWSKAIHIVRFLREQGVDVEPELKTLSDFKEVIDPALESYQTFLDNTVELPNNSRDFVKKSP